MGSVLNVKNKDINQLVLWIASVFVVSFDHKGPEGGSASVYVVLAFVLGLQCIQLYFKTQWHRRDLLALGVIFLPVFWSMPARLINHYEWKSFASASVGYVMFGLSFLCASQVVKHGASMLKTVLLISIVARLLYLAGIFFFNGAPVNDSGFVESEYGIKPGEFVLLGSLWLFLCFDKGLYAYSSWILFVSMVLISIGMNQRINWILLSFFMIVFFWKARLSLSSLAIVLGAVCCTVVIGNVFFSMDVLITLRRFLVVGSSVPYGVEPSVMWRIAEAISQLKLTFLDPERMLFGNGLGAPYGSGLDLFAETVGKWNVKDTVSYIGHNFWIYSIYANGLLVGLVYPSGLLLLLKKSLRSVRFSSSGAEIFTCAFWIGIALSTISASPLSSRYVAFMAGVLLSLHFYLRRTEEDKSSKVETSRPKPGAKLYV